LRVFSAFNYHHETTEMSNHISTFTIPYAICDIILAAIGGQKALRTAHCQGVNFGTMLRLSRRNDHVI